MEPHALTAQANAKEDYFSHRYRLASRTFHLGAEHIRSLKRSIIPKKPVSTFVAVSALAWTAFVRAKELAAGDDTHLTFPADLRARLHPPVGDGYFGNCVRGCLASADAGELLGEWGLLRASRAIQEAVRELDAAPLAGIETWIERLGRLPVARLASVAASPRFRMHETADLGFGRPGRVYRVSTEHDGWMVLCAGLREGEVQVTVSLDPARMDAFEAHINCRPRPRI